MEVTKTETPATSVKLPRLSPPKVPHVSWFDKLYGLKQIDVVIPIDVTRQHIQNGLRVRIPMDEIERLGLKGATYDEMLTYIGHISCDVRIVLQVNEKRIRQEYEDKKRSGGVEVEANGA